MKITEDIKYVGVNDHQVDLFEGQFEVPLGMAYNSYVIIDEKIAVGNKVHPLEKVDFSIVHANVENIFYYFHSNTPSLSIFAFFKGIYT